MQLQVGTQDSTVIIDLANLQRAKPFEEHEACSSEIEPEYQLASTSASVQLQAGNQDSTMVVDLAKLQRRPDRVTENGYPDKKRRNTSLIRSAIESLREKNAKVSTRFSCYLQLVNLFKRI